MIAAVLPAAGAGERFKHSPTDAPKQFIGLEGRPIYLWSLSTLAAHEKIDIIVVVVPQLSLDAVQAEISRVLPANQSEKIIVTAGGKTRQNSVHNGLERLGELTTPPAYVMVHDAARPLLTAKLIDQVVESVTANGACTVAIPVTDTIKKARDNVVGETLDRSELVQIQTPQAARFEWLLQAHRKAAAENFGTTDDSTILEHSGHKVHIVTGSPYNVKITNPEDLSLCQSLASVLEQRS
ncbi:MAG: 2-C-methyl-D-erythritol 4-phosphate cytidylyltransferase [Cyanobacteria bacterium SZAS-4]|nr:2-C-methyl-D-erythritol 4-phosphate cytidylyltransferase [Cyanobacteria bacterium SZAS-4]